MSKATNTIWIYLDDDMKADLHKLANAEFHVEPSVPRCFHINLLMSRHSSTKTFVNS